MEREVVMICIDSRKTVDILLSNIEMLRERWVGKEDLIHKRPFEIYRENHINQLIHTVNFKDTGFSFRKPLK